MPMASRHGGVEMYQKGRVLSVFAEPSRPMSRASEIYETEFEDDDTSDFEEYNGRTSEDSVGCTATLYLGSSSCNLAVRESKQYNRLYIRGSANTSFECLQ